MDKPCPMESRSIVRFENQILIRILLLELSSTAALADSKHTRSTSELRQHDDGP